MIIKCLAVGAGGFIGSVFRYLIGLAPFLNKWDIPLHTLAVNVIGAVIIGMVVKSAESYESVNETAVLLLKVGVCGGFTTFSTFSLEAVTLFQNGRYLLGGAYVLLSVALCVAGVLLGQCLARAVAHS